MPRKESKKNAGLLLAYLQSKDPLTVQEINNLVTKAAPKKKAKAPRPRSVGRPKRVNRPTKPAANRTLPGEERYKITLKTERIASMKTIAETLGISIKQVYENALSAFIEKYENK